VSGLCRRVHYLLSLFTRYKSTARIAGILYLHDISQRRLPEKRITAIINELCQMCDPQNIILLTTMWNDVQSNVGERRERQLDDFWAEMVKRGSRMKRFQDKNNRGSVWDVINSLVGQVNLGCT
jgi:hypothetical protein